MAGRSLRSWTTGGEKGQTGRLDLVQSQAHEIGATRSESKERKCTHPGYPSPQNRQNQTPQRPHGPELVVSHFTSLLLPLPLMCYLVHSHHIV